MTIKPPPDTRFKSLFASLTDQHPPINTGLLTIASDIFTYDPSVEIIDGVSQENCRELIADRVRAGNLIVGVGVQSAYEYLEALEIARLIKGVSPETPVIFGGQQCAPLGRRVFEHTPDVDAVGIGQGEAVFRQLHAGTALEEVPGLITRKRPAGVFGPKIKLDDLGPLRHELNPNCRSFTPYVEDSRGCQYHCKFCTNDAVFDGRIDIRGIESFKRDLEHVLDLYGTDELVAVMASNFGVDVQSTLAKAEVLKSYNIRWTTELRMDSPWEQYLPQLYASGLRILTSGMESASPEILLRIGKTGNPKRYVERASGLIHAAAEFPEMVVKLSYMIYIGEKRRTLQQTIDFLEAHRDRIDTTLLTPTYLVEGTPLWHQVCDSRFAEEMGFRFIPDPYWASRGIHFGDLSDEISYDQAVEISRVMEARFSNDRANSCYHSAHQVRVDKGAKNLWRDRFKD